jgi:tRNA(Ile)-lysidine synthase
MSRQDPLTRAEFDAAMATLGPFEASPHVAVAVSGGADSMALCLLADGWARRRGGQVTAITVDHGLRPGSAAEVVEVGRWMAVLGIAHRCCVGTAESRPPGYKRRREPSVTG